ncbi:hypothetical protein Tco_0772011 [Tanacetum coccineum]|uniref:Uncharacterized protein n=1 Tax=Tanacetum coccineum TaxID=301880 RepID=A0ABQ4ZHM9_9ASTR
MMQKMKEGYGDGELTLYPTQVFSVNNWALKPNQHEEPPFTYYMLAICVADTPVVFKAPKTSSKAESVSQGTKPRAKPGHKKLLTSSKQPSASSKEATKGGSSKAPTSFKTGHSKKIKESSSAMDSNPSQPLVSTLVDTRMHKEDQQATGGPTSLGVTSEARANPQLNSGMSASNLNKPIYLASFIVHSESVSGCDASADSIAKADPRLSAPSNFVPQQQGMNEGTKNPSYDHLSVGTDPHVLADKTKSISEGLETVLTQPTTGKGVSFIARQDLPSKLNELTGEVKGLKKQVHELEIELPRDLNDIPTKVDDFTKIFTSLTSQVTELKTLQWELPAEFLSLPAQVLDSASSKAKDQSVPSAGQADTMPAEGEKNTNQATISHLFQRRAEKNAEKENLNKQQPKPTPPPATTIIPTIITTTTTQMQSPSPQYPQKGSS